MLHNQPEMDLTASSPNQMAFSLAGRSGIDASKEPHMHSLTIAMADADHLSETWTLYENGQSKDSVNLMFARVR